MWNPRLVKSILGGQNNNQTGSGQGYRVDGPEVVCDATATHLFSTCCAWGDTLMLKECTLVQVCVSRSRELPHAAFAAYRSGRSCWLPCPRHELHVDDLFLNLEYRCRHIYSRLTDTPRIFFGFLGSRVHSCLITCHYVFQEICYLCCKLLKILKSNLETQRFLSDVLEPSMHT